VIPFCATGNDGSLTLISFPARFPECVAVGATNWSDARASYSNAGAQIAVSAPGGDGASSPLGNSFILSTVPNATFFSPAGTVENNATYGWKSGTSMATPQAVGLAALLISTGVNPADVVDRIKTTSDDLGAEGWDPMFGEGRINACRALDPAQLRIELPGALNNQESSAIVPVTLFGGPRFVVEQFDVANLTLGDGRGAEANVAARGDVYRSAIADVDLDGIMDLTLKFSRNDLVANGDLQPGMRTMVLGGSVGCRRVAGSATVKVQK
jgi:subtilisin family serine protease